jgi:hypothetical protein
MSNVASKALKFGGVISKRLESASEDSMSKNDEDVEVQENVEDYQEGEEGELHEIDDFENQEVIKSIKEEDEEANDPAV